MTVLAADRDTTGQTRPGWDPPTSDSAGEPPQGATRLRRLGVCALVVVTAVVVTALCRMIGLPLAVSVFIAVAGAAAVLSVDHTNPHHASSSRVIVRLALLVGLSATTWSYVGALTDPGSAPVSDRTATWMRDHHMNLVVDTVEQHLYGQGAPTSNPVDLTKLPNTPAASSLAATPSSAPSANSRVGQVPPVVGPLIDGNLAGEGRWTPNPRQVNGVPVTYTTFVRPDPDHTGVVAAAVMLEPSATKVVYVPGTIQPGGTGWSWGSGIPESQRPDLVAAFNSGWKQKDKPGGAYTEGRTAAPLVDGKASVVIYTDGHADIGAWGVDVTMTADVVSVRQNLDLIVADAQPVDGLATGGTGRWGRTKYQLQFVQRSGLGVTADGALVYVAGGDLDTAALAHALVQVGAVRAMELDIHAPQPTFNFFTPAPGTRNGVTGEKLLAIQRRPATRYLSADQRDFFAVVVR